MNKTPLPVIDELMALRGKSWRLARKEDDLLDQIQSTILYRAEVDKAIDRLESALVDWKKTKFNA